MDLEFIRKTFDSYVNKYDINDKKIKLKCEHIKRVANISGELARSLNLCEEDINLAIIIGLFHDIGRFEQIKRYNTFNDKSSVNHAKLGIDILFDDNLIDIFKIDKKYYKTIKTAILNHNKDFIDKDLSSREELFSKIIRDADKLDIFYILSSDEFETCFWFEEFNLYKPSLNIYLEYRYLHKLNYKHVKNNVDLVINPFTLLYDLNYTYSYRYLFDKDYMNKFCKLVNDKFNHKIIYLTRFLYKRYNKFIKKKIN